MPTLKQMLDISFWFSSQAPLVSQSIRILWGVFGLFIILAIVVRIVIALAKGKLAPWYSRGLRKSFTMFMVMGILGLVLLFMGYEGVPYLSSRAFYPVWLIVVAGWVIHIIVHVTRKLAVDKTNYGQQKNIKEYLPGKK